MSIELDAGGGAPAGQGSGRLASRRPGVNVENIVVEHPNLNRGDAPVSRGQMRELLLERYRNDKTCMIVAIPQRARGVHRQLWQLWQFLHDAAAETVAWDPNRMRPFSPC